MAAIEIRDLDVRQKLDKKAMAMIFGGVSSPALPNGWALISTQTQKVNAGQIWVPSKKITGAYENAFMFQTVTTVTAQYTEYTVK